MNHMKSNRRTSSVHNKNRRRWAVSLSSTAALGWTAAQAQPVLVQPVQYGDRVTTVEQASTNWLGSVAGPPLQAPAAGPETRPLQLGPVRFHPHLGYQVVYGDGVLRGVGNPSTTWLHTVSPGLFTELSQYWNMDFTASFNRYSNAGSNNSESYFGALRGHIPREQWLLDFGYVATLTEQTQVETATNSLQNTHLVTASGTYNYQTRLSLELSAMLDARLAQGFTDYYTVSTLEWLNFQATTKTTLGLGVGGGYNLVKPGPDWTFQQMQARAVWLPGAKLTLQASGGIQLQQFSGSDETGSTNAVSGTDIAPLFGVSAAYRPFEQTALSLSANHVVGNSYERGQFSETTTLNGGLRQRFVEQVYLDVVPGYTIRNYKSTLRGAPDGREDKYFTIYAGLSTVLFKKLNVGVFYQFSDNDSDVEGFAFDSTQVGLRLDYRY
jgi:hypothetical protein